MAAIDQLWADLARADALGDKELAEAIMGRIRAVEERGPLQYAGAALETLGDIPVGLGEMGLQAATGVANRVAPESGVARYMTDAADKFTGARRELAQNRERSAEDDALLNFLQTGTDIASYFLPATGVAKGSSQAPGFARRVAENTARDVAEVTAQTAIRAGRDPENAGENIATDAAITAALSPAIQGIGAAGRAAYGGMARNFFKQNPASVAAQEAAARRGPGGEKLIRGEDLIQSAFTRNVARAAGDTLDSVTGRNEKILQQQKDRFLDEAGAGIDDALDQDFLSLIDDSFVRQYKAIRQKKRDLYKEAERAMDPKGDFSSGVNAPGALSLLDKLQRRVQEAVETYGPDAPGLNAYKTWGNYGEAPFSVWGKRLRALNKDIRSLEKSSDPDYNKVEILRGIRDDVMSTMDEWAGNDTAWKTARDYYKKKYLPYKEDLLLKTIPGKRGGPRGDLAREKLMARNDPREADLEALVGALDKEGVDAAYRAMIQNVKNAATRSDEGVEISWSPARAATELERIAGRLEKTASPEVKKALDDWRKIFRASDQLGMDAGRSQTGRSLAQMAGAIGVLSAAGGFFGGDVAGASAGALGGFGAGAALMLTSRSPRFRALMRKRAEMGPKHPDLPRIEEQMAKMISKVTASQTEAE